VTEQPPAAATESDRGSALARAARFAGRHPIGLLQTLFALLVAIVVLQNLEPTSIDLLFWSVPNVPKLVLVLAAMAIGALAWEILRRLLPRRRSAAPPGAPN
jgi:uncharacterized integral membrane protein